MKKYLEANFNQLPHTNINTPKMPLQNLDLHKTVDHSKLSTLKGSPSSHMHLMTPDLGFHDKILQSNLVMEAMRL
jgi:hypothetical protein